MLITLVPGPALEAPGIRLALIVGATSALADVPTGTVTCLLTNIIGITRLWAQAPMPRPT